MVTRQYIFNKVAFFLKEEQRFFTTGQIWNMIGIDAFRRIAEDIDYPKTNISTFLSSGRYQVSMPLDFLKVDENSDVTFGYMNVSSSGVTTIATVNPEKQKLIGRGNVLTATPNVPSNYFFENETVLAVYPKPSTSGVLVVPYVQVPTVLSSDTDTNQLTEVAYMAAAYWVVSECFMRDNATQQASFYTLYEKEILRLRRRFGDRYEIDYDIQPKDAYLGHNTP